MSDVAATMAADALEAQKFSRKHLVLELDFTPDSVRELESHIDTVEYAVRGGKSPENLAMLVRIWGAYLGESLRRQGGGEWSEESSQEGPRPVLIREAARLCPHDQVRHRLLDGSSYNLWIYFANAFHQPPSTG